MRRLVMASAAAVAVQPFVSSFCVALFAWIQGEPAAFLDYFGIAPAILAVAALHLLAIGLPGFYLLRRVARPSWASMAVLGWIAGSAAIAIFSWPLFGKTAYSFSTLWHGEFTPLMVDGQPTRAGWLSYLEGIALFGLQGMCGGLAFFAVWRKHGV